MTMNTMPTVSNGTGLHTCGWRGGGGIYKRRAKARVRGGGCGGRGEGNHAWNTLLQTVDIKGNRKRNK